MKAIRLRTEYLKTPLGLGITTPRLSWNCGNGITQTAYQIIARRDGRLVWDSGKVSSSRMHLIPWEGERLKSRDRIAWAVRLWDENDQPGEETESWFEMGLLDASDWQAQWISGAYRAKKGIRYPVDCFKKAFRVKKPVAFARLYASARGLYAVTLNGRRIEDFVFAPGMTDYRKRIQYQTYDIMNFLQAENILELQLADGWYRGSCAAYGVTEVYGRETSLIAQLEITYGDGSRETICSDASWSWSNDGPIRFADLKDGEVINAGMIPSYSNVAKAVASPRAPLAASDNVPVTEHEHFTAHDLGKGVMDFGQNLAGYLSFTAKGKAGQKVRIVCGETLDADGNVDLSNMQESRPAGGWNQMALIRKLMANQVKGSKELTPKQEIVFTCSGDNDRYKTAFAVFGFRYAQIFADEGVNVDELTAIAVYSDMEQTGDFCCSNEKINRLVENARWSMKSNFLDLPTDCPTRERLGWTGDAQIFFNTGAFFMDTAAFFRKWLRDMEDAQYRNGLLPAVLPFQGVEMMYKSTGSSVGWADAVYLIPWRYYLRYGDMEVLQSAWPMIRRYADYLLKNREKDGTFRKGVQLGEWLEPVEFRDGGAKDKHPEEATAYFCLAMTIISNIAKILGDTAYANSLLQAEELAKKTYRRRFGGDRLNTDRPAKLVRPLALGLLEGDEKNHAQARLKQAAEHFGYRVGTGFLSTPFILKTLTEAGDVEAAYQMLENEEKPGWLYEVNHGATTVWETWEGCTTGENNSGSLNHYSPGSVCEWLFDTVGGIRIKEENHFEIVPMPGGSLTWCEAKYLSPYGKVVCKWNQTKDGYLLIVHIPAGTKAEIRLKNECTRHVLAGTHQFHIDSK